MILTDLVLSEIVQDVSVVFIAQAVLIALREKELIVDSVGNTSPDTNKEPPIGGCGVTVLWITPVFLMSNEEYLRDLELPESTLVRKENPHPKVQLFIFVLVTPVQSSDLDNYFD